MSGIFHNFINNPKSGYKFTNYSAIIAIFALSFVTLAGFNDYGDLLYLA